MTRNGHLMVWYLDAEDQWSKTPRYRLLRDSKRTLVTKKPQSAQYQGRLIKKQTTWLVEFQPYRVERLKSMASM